MGLFDVFGSKEARDKGALRKLQQKLTERYGPPENRQKAIEQLAGLGTPGALLALCMRFTVRSDIGITDDEEKESVRRHLVEAGEQAVAPVKQFLEEQESGISWGLRVLAGLLPAEQVKAVSTALLARVARQYSRDPEKKLVLLSWLTEHHAPGAAAAAGGQATGGPYGARKAAGATPTATPTATATPTQTQTATSNSTSTAAPTPTAAPTGTEVASPEETAILPLLEDFSDDVRISATRALARLGAGPAGREAIIHLLLRDRDNARVRGEAFQALHDLSADVKGHRPSVEELLVEPWFLDKEGRVKRRG